VSEKFVSINQRPAESFLNIFAESKVGEGLQVIASSVNTLAISVITAFLSDTTGEHFKNRTGHKRK
jgi:hypothetical protein